ncbi:type II toxin-antitoxin system RelE/ParE family toxin [Prosthecomicrobium sp. N25]|uniref:type II toxin-antitoxin system RelE/ParE family toxin n=1 Tax=Prosthecomicrobium sp. N25 TaxID=3129254 RepID=UPI0030784635
MGYRLTAAADEDLVRILLEGDREFGFERAVRYVRKINDIFDLIARNPRLARERNEISPGLRAHPHRSHLILYVIDDSDEVLIVRVRHLREDWSSNPF